MITHLFRYSHIYRCGRGSERQANEYHVISCWRCTTGVTYRRNDRFGSEAVVQPGSAQCPLCVKSGHSPSHELSQGSASWAATISKEKPRAGLGDVRRAFRNCQKAFGSWTLMQLQIVGFVPEVAGALVRSGHVRCAPKVLFERLRAEQAECGCSPNDRLASVSWRYIGSAYDAVSFMSRLD